MAQGTMEMKITLTVITVGALPSRVLTLGPMMVSTGVCRGVTFQSQALPSTVHLPLVGSNMVTLALLLLRGCSMVTLLLLRLV